MRWLDGYKIIFVLVGIMASFVLCDQSVSVATTNQAPIADAGPSRYAGSDPIVLNGTGSYSLEILNCTWTQLSGPPVTITGADTTTPTISGFVQTDEIQECEFELIVDDGELTSLPDTVKVIIVPDFGASTLRQENPPFDRNKPTVIFFDGGNCVTGGGTFHWPGWAEKVNIIIFPYYAPDPGVALRTYYRCGDIIIVYLSSVAPDYKQPIQSIGFSTGGDPAIDVGIHLNRVYGDARYAVNRVTQLDAPCRWSEDRDFYYESAELFLKSAVDGEQCWMDEYYGLDASGAPHRYFTFPDELVVSLGLSHLKVEHWCQNSLTANDMNDFNGGLVAGAYWSVIGPGKNLQLAPQTDAFYFRWDGDELSGSMSFFDEAKHPGRLPEPVTLIGPPDGAVVDANGAVFSCEVSENSIGYQLIFGKDPYHMTYLVSNTPNPPNDLITTFPFEQTWWTVKAYDLYGSTIYADPICINAENVMPQTIENITMTRQYSSIQQAINDALDGQEIVISPGIYQYLENINFKGKNITLRSTYPNDPAVVAATVINGWQHDPVINLSGSKGAGCVIDGLTIIGGKVSISCRDASPTIQNCTIVGSNGNVAIDYWDIYEPTILDCNIIGQINQLYDPRLAAYWKLDETEGDIAHDSVGEYDGQLYGDPVWQPTDGMINGALLLDGIDDFVGTYSVPVESDGQMSVFVWIKGGAPGQVIVSEFRSVSWLMADASQGYLKTDLKETGDTAQSLVSEVTITDGQWHRVGLTWDGTNRILYIDNIAVASDKQQSLERATMELNIGCGPYETPGTFWSGLIDDVRIYNRTVTP
jgi:hypothetical protein